MTKHVQPQFNQMNIVTGDAEPLLRLYRNLGVEM